MTVTLAFFLLELVLNSIAKPQYVCRFPFWLDLAASSLGSGFLGHVVGQTERKKLADRIYETSTITKHLDSHSLCVMWFLHVDSISLLIIADPRAGSIEKPALFVTAISLGAFGSH